MTQTPSLFALMRVRAAADYLADQLFSPAPVMAARPSYSHRANSLVTAVATLQPWLPDSAGVVSSLQVERMRLRWWERQLVAARERIRKAQEQLLSGPMPSAPSPALIDESGAKPVASPSVVDLIRSDAAAKCLVDSILRGMTVPRTRMLAFGLPGDFDGLAEAVSPYMPEHPGRLGSLARERERAAWWEPQLEEALCRIMKLQRAALRASDPSSLP